MANISGSNSEKVYSIPRWLGLNEHPDGDTRLRLGEASEMVNWRITRDGNLKRRPGRQFVMGLRNTYMVQAAETATELPLGATETVPCYSAASAMTLPGTVILDGALGNKTAAQMAEYGNTVYFYYDEHAWQYNSGTSAYKLKAVPAVGTTKPIAGMWTGMVNGVQMFLVACDNKLWSLYDEANDVFTRNSVGTPNTEKGVSFFPFDNIVYLLNGKKYYSYNGTALTEVEGYRPLVAIAISPVVGDTDGSENGVTTAEYINRLNGKRRVWLSPDGEGSTFQLPEAPTASVDWVKNLANGATVSNYNVNTETGQITFTSTPYRGVNRLEVAYSVSTTLRSQVESELFAELFSGTTDTRVFLYGDGTNRAIYSGMDYDGMPRADYFPDQYEVHVGDSNTPITSLIRHYSSLVTFKPDSCWTMEHGVVELATSELTPAIYCVPVNKDKGNLAMGQVRLVDNNPITCFGNELYRWINSSYYNSNLSRDERQAQRISDRVQSTLATFDLKNCLMWDDNDHQEYYVCDKATKRAIVWNYATDTWYVYENFDAVCMCNFQGELYIGTSDGKILRLTDRCEGDEGEPIEARWISGAMDFSADYSRKYSSMMWVGLKPAEGTSVDVTVITDRKNTFREKIVSSEKAKVAGQPFMVKTKIKAKKFVYYRLQLSVDDKQPPVTVTNVDFRVRPTGYAK